MTTRGCAAVLLGALGALLLGCGQRAAPSAEPLGGRSAQLVTALPPMSASRAEPVCGVLRSGKAIVAGGQRLSSAELFDPATKSWTATASMSVARQSASSALLADGRFLVVGGEDAGAATTAEIFDPATGAWTPIASMARERYYAALVPLADGRVLAVGGINTGGNAQPSAERWDPKLDRWDPVPSRPEDFVGKLAWATLEDGTIFTVHGYRENTAYLFDPRTLVWTATQPFAAHRTYAAVVPLPGGKLLVAGGFDQTATTALSTTEIYDPATKGFTPGPTLQAPAANAWWSALPAGTIVLGGPTNAFDLIAPDASSVLPGGFLVDARTAPCPFRTPTGVVVAAGRNVAGGGSFSSAELITAAIDGTACKSDVECASAYCDPTAKSCAKRVADAGAPSPTPAPVAGSAKHCLRDSECSSAHCADGVCCDRACDEPCYSCAMPSSPGRCTAEPIGVDLRGVCGAALACTGTCDGAGACIGATAGSQCAPSRCLTSTTGVGPTFCAARGARCPSDAAVAFDCGAYVCDPAFGACRDSCASSADCAGGSLCDVPSGHCVDASTSGATDGGGGKGCSVGAGADHVGAAFAALLAFAVSRRRRRAARARA